MKEEVWVSIEGFNGKYSVSNRGRVRSNSYGNILKPFDNGRGYKLVTLCKDNKHYKRYVHRLVAQAFIPNPDDLPEVNFKDENKSNADVENLEWCTGKYNMNYGTLPLRQRYITTKLKGRPIYCLETKKCYESIKACSNDMKIPGTNIGRVCRKERENARGYHFKYLTK